MKTNLITAAAIAFFIGNLTVSCNSCEDKNNDPIPMGTPEASSSSVEYDEANSGSIYDGSDQNGTSINNGNNGNTSAATERSSSKATTGKATKSPAKPGRVLSNTYSAPNGTDAENHDGDPYTKHDTTSRPTGTSIR